MKSVIQHSVYGEIVYEESFWTGKKKLSLNGANLPAVSKKEFLMPDGETKTTVLVKGNFLFGTKLAIKNEVITVTPPIKWYELLLSVMIFALVLVWGNSVTLCSIIPIVGGAIGGGISGMMTVLNLLVMKSTKNIWLKLAVWLAFIVLTFFICFAVGAIIIKSLT